MMVEPDVVFNWEMYDRGGDVVRMVALMLSQNKYSLINYVQTGHMISRCNDDLQSCPIIMNWIMT